MVQLNLKTAAFLSLLTAMSPFVAAAPASELEIASTAAAFDFNKASVDYATKRWNTTSALVSFDTTIAHPDGSTTAIVRQNGLYDWYSPIWPIWNSYGKIEFDKNNKIVGFDSKYYPGLTTVTSSPYFFAGNPDSVTYLDSLIPGLEATYNATSVLIYGKDKHRAGYWWDGSRTATASVYHLKRKSDGEILTVYLCRFNNVVPEVLTCFAGLKKDNPLIL
ncbi:hypothetical protein BXZ70DRAFT_558121 [Cristinia sonorae]|uniref:Uncharacterized protein n=1 Tax=Cristinia sonorae TaxID=1940300 RepID=A0A8K0XLK8_9AGAR|nr:hypothetical protein BXZ70DRAFT_558121 [Cristinia sonorae]